jgi:hypothetical protein
VNKPTTWYIAHVLASIVALFIVLGVTIEACMSITGIVPAPQGWWGVSGIITTIAVFWFWGWMLSDYFRNRPNHPTLWGWSLFLASFGAALVYFFIIWRPRQLGRQT